MEKIIQITAGKGPVECCFVVAQVFKLIVKEAPVTGLLINVLNKIEGDVNGTFSSISLEVSGEEEVLTAFLSQWLGTIQWIGKSEFRKLHRRKNWFIGVYELDLNKEILTINENQIKYEAIRSGGPGGQHVNKVSTAVRAYHLPTGLNTLAAEGRSQLQNKKKAKEKLINLLKTKQLEDKKEKIKSSWKNHQALKRGNPIKVLRGSDFKSQFVNKKYKSKRIMLKQDLKRFESEN